MKKKYEINYLSEDFFEKYDSKHFPEIEHKLNRPYLVLVLKVENNTYAIPFRTNVSHKACYRFKNSSRDTHSFTGLDYSKAVVVNDDRYIGTAAFIDEKEFLAKLDLIADRAFEDQCTTANPRVPLVSEIKQILLDSYYGK